MELITSFFATSEMAILLIPAIIVLVIALIVINVHKKVEVIAPMPQAPVTTTPTPPAPSEVAQQAIPVPQTVQPVTQAVPVTSPEVALEQTQAAAPSWRPTEQTVIVEESPAPVQVASAEVVQAPDASAQIAAVQNPVVSPTEEPISQVSPSSVQQGV